MPVLTESFSAGQTRRYNIPGGFFRLLSTSLRSPVDISAYSIESGNTEYINGVLDGLAFTLNFDFIQITSSVAQSVQFAIFPGIVNYDRALIDIGTMPDVTVSGSISVTGSNVSIAGGTLAISGGEISTIEMLGDSNAGGYDILLLSTDGVLANTVYEMEMSVEFYATSYPTAPTTNGSYEIRASGAAKYTGVVDKTAATKPSGDPLVITRKIIAATNSSQSLSAVFGAGSGMSKKNASLKCIRYK